MAVQRTRDPSKLYSQAIRGNHAVPFASRSRGHPELERQLSKLPASLRPQLELLGQRLTRDSARQRFHQRLQCHAYWRTPRQPRRPGQRRQHHGVAEVRRNAAATIGDERGTDAKFHVVAGVRRQLPQEPQHFERAIQAPFDDAYAANLQCRILVDGIADAGEHVQDAFVQQEVAHARADEHGGDRRLPWQTPDGPNDRAPQATQFRLLELAGTAHTGDGHELGVRKRHEHDFAERATE